MAFDISDKLVVAVSARALFDLEDANRIFEAEGVDAYRKYQREHEDDRLAPGLGYPFIQRLLALNRMIPGYTPVEVVLLSRNDPDTGMRVLKSIAADGLGIERSAFVGGADPMKYLRPFNVSLYLSASFDVVKRAVDAGFPAGFILPRDRVQPDTSDAEFRLAFDFDGVLANDEAERVFAEGGLSEFEAHEGTRSAEGLQGGPLYRFLEAISAIQRREMDYFADDPDHRPVLRTAVVTSRAAPAHLRAVTTLREWGIRVDEAIFLGGVRKGEFLAEFRPHLFFDDQEVHVDDAVAHTAAVHIPYGIRNRG